MTFPSILLPADTGARSAAGLVAWLADTRVRVGALLDASGAVLVRDHDVSRPEAVAAVVGALGLDTRAYGEGLARRTELAPGVYSATALDPAAPLALHSELAHTATPPDILVFACAQPADEGGATLLVDGCAVPAAFGVERWADWRTRGLAYLTCRPEGAGPLSLGRTWSQVYGTTVRAEVERRLHAEGVAFTWGDAGQLRTRLTGPVVVPHPSSGVEAWYNHLLLWHITALGARGLRLRTLLGDEDLPHQATWLDGTPIPDTRVDEVRAVVDGLARPVAWRPGDLLLVDNRRMMHGRQAFRGERRLLVALCDAPGARP